LDSDEIEYLKDFMGNKPDGTLRFLKPWLWRLETPRPPATVFIHDYYGPEMREPWYSWASNLYSKVERVGNSLARLHL